MSQRDGITVIVQRLRDRRILQLQWADPESGEALRQSARSRHNRKAETARAEF
jgi:hypothetical protein